MKPTIWIGKSGIAESQIAEIKLQLKKKKLVKIKLLKSAMGDMDKKDLAKELALKANCDILEMKGFIVTLVKKW